MKVVPPVKNARKNIFVELRFCYCQCFSNKHFSQLTVFTLLTLLHSEWSKLHRVLAILSALGLKALVGIAFKKGVVI